MTNLFKSIGLPLDTWKLLDEAQRSLVSLGVVLPTATQSDILTYVIRHGVIRLGQMAEKELDTRGVLA